MTGKTLNYKKDCLCEFGECVQADTYDEPWNDMQERSKDAIYLRPNDNAQGGHIVMDLKTGEEITRGHICLLYTSEWGSLCFWAIMIRHTVFRREVIKFLCARYCEVAYHYTWYGFVYCLV